MTEQGIPRDSIEVWMDKDRDGCLFSCMKCFAEYGKRDGARWHMQDDVVISRDFREKTEQYNDGIVSGFFREEWQPLTPLSGRVPAVFMWNSFQCIRLPDEIIRGCAEWFFTEAVHDDRYKEYIDMRKCDDTMFYIYMAEHQGDQYCYNLEPSIVDHVDYLIGGSVINRWRGHPARGDLWEDESIIEELKDKLARR